MKPAELILDHLAAVKAAFANAGPKAAWGRLQTTAPDLCAAITYNTFKTVAPVMLNVEQKLHRKCETQAEALRAEVAELQERLHNTVTQASERPSVALMFQCEGEDPKGLHNALVQPPKTFEGWSVQTDRKGYTRLHKKIGGKVRSLYIGKTWDPEKARKRIKLHSNV